MILTTMLTQLSEAVRYLARLNDANRIKFGDAGGCEVMVSVLRTHGTSNAAVAEKACGAIINLAVYNDANKIKFGDAGGCEVMVSVLRTHGTSNAAVALCACWAITNLSFNVENKRRLVAADARTVVASCAENSKKADALNRLKTSWWSW